MRQSKTLNNGSVIPMLGLGVFRAEKGEAVQAVEKALELGYRHIDTADIYGNEKEVGQAIRQSGVPREEIFLTTKLWNEDQRQGRQREAFQESLERLGMDYVDLYLIHWPVKEKIQESWKVLEQLNREGLAKAIGVSNFQEHYLDTVMEGAEITPALNQCECHPYLSQKPLRAKCAGMGIAFEAYCPLGGMGQGNLTTLPQLVDIGQKYGKTAAQAILRWEVQGDVITIPKSVHAARIAENMDIFDFELSDADMAAIDRLNKDQRVNSDPDNFNF